VRVRLDRNPGELSPDVRHPPPLIALHQVQKHVFLSQRMLAMSARPGRALAQIAIAVLNAIAGMPSGNWIACRRDSTLSAH
jgi:ABC-type nitrate/sulfonate/bicarbonate transport system ATPase subunit